MPFVAPLVGLASIGLGVAGAVAQSRAADASRAAEKLDLENRRQAAVLEYDKLDIDVAQLQRTAGVVTGGISAAVAGAGAEITSGVSAQARAVTLSALSRDIEVLNLNADISATRLGFGPETEGGKTILKERFQKTPEGIELRAESQIRARAFDFVTERPKLLDAEGRVLPTKTALRRFN